MKVWYKAVCDEHKEYTDVFVSNPSCTAHYLAERDAEIQGWLEKHHGCALRFLHIDLIPDEVWDTYTSVPPILRMKPS